MLYEARNIGFPFFLRSGLPFSSVSGISDFYFFEWLI